MNSPRDLTGKRFGRLLALEKVGSTSGGNALWKCICSCSDKNEVIVRADCLREGKTTSCGCVCKEVMSARMKKYFDEDSKHLASVFAGMKTRCYNKHDESYLGWGARGIFICDEWLNSVDSFIEWAKTHGYKRGLTIDRIDNNGPYASWNCRWVTVTVQNNNMRGNRMFKVMGMRKSIADWARYFDTDPHLFWGEPDHVVEHKLNLLMNTKIGNMLKYGDMSVEDLINHRIEKECA